MTGFEEGVYKNITILPIRVSLFILRHRLKREALAGEMWRSGESVYAHNETSYILPETEPLLVREHGLAFLGRRVVRGSKRERQPESHIISYS